MTSVLYPDLPENRLIMLIGASAPARASRCWPAPGRPPGLSPSTACAASSATTPASHTHHVSPSTGGAAPAPSNAPAKVADLVLRRC